MDFLTSNIDYGVSRYKVALYLDSGSTYKVALYLSRYKATGRS